MKKYKKFRNIRAKAPFGGAIGAGISAAATLTAAGINAAAQNKAAKQQADAIKRQTDMQIRSMQEINNNNNRLQEQQIEFQTAENERNRKIQQDIQMTLQMQQGALNEADRLNSAKIQLKKGGRIKPHNSFLWGSNGNLPFKVIDGGGVQHIAVTPEGYDLYEIYGNDHDHYHKTQGGKNKTGVGIKFAGGKVVEGEGNQNSNQGELMLVTPNDAKFISKHSIKGFNPTKAVLNGMNPSDAFIYQELIKGKANNSSPLRKKQALGGGYFPYLDKWAISNATTNNQLFPYLDKWAISNNNIKNTSNNNNNNSNNNNDNNTSTTSTTSNNFDFKNHISDNAGAYISAGANLLGAGISNIGNRIAASKLNNAYTNAANRLSNAYDNLKTIDENLINRDNYQAPHSMAAVRSAYVNVNPEIGLVDRANQRRLSAINKNTTSSAAALSRLNKAEVDAYDMRSKIYGEANRIAENIRQQNAQTLTNVSDANANRDAQANQAYLQSKLALLQYNNDIANERITGKAQAQADAIMGRANTLASINQTNATNLANAISNIGKNIYDTKNMLDKRKFDFNSLLLGASDSNKLLLAANNPGDLTYKSMLESMLVNYQNAKPGTTQYSTLEQIKNLLNQYK